MDEGGHAATSRIRCSPGQRRCQVKKKRLMLGIASILFGILIAAPAYAQGANGQPCEPGASADRAQYGDCDGEDVIVVPPPDNGPDADVDTTQQNTSTVQQSSATYGNAANSTINPGDAWLGGPTIYVAATSAEGSEVSVASTESPAQPVTLPDTGGISPGAPFLAALLLAWLYPSVFGRLRRWLGRR